MKPANLRWLSLITAMMSLLLSVPDCGMAAPPKTQIDQWIATLKSNADLKPKAEACRELALWGGRDAIAPLVALLSDPNLSHMARYGLERIPDPAVDVALRDALGKLSGRPLVGVIGSVGVRRDTKAVKILAGLLTSPEADVVQAAARSLGKIGNPAAAKSLQSALPTVSANNQLALCEGLFRCAEALTAQGKRKEALELYEQLRDLPTSHHQVKTGAIRGAILLRGKGATTLLGELLSQPDYAVFSAAVRTSHEMPGADATQILIASLTQPTPDRQVMILQALGRRADALALPAIANLTGPQTPKPVRLAAVQTLAEFGNPTVITQLVPLTLDADRAIAQAAQETLASLQGPAVDSAVMGMVKSSDQKQRLVGIELTGRRRMSAAVPELLKTTQDADAGIRSAAIKKFGELANPTQLPAALDLITRASAPADLDVAEQAASAICGRADNLASSVTQIAARLKDAQPLPKGALLRVLGTIGDGEALKTVRQAVNDPQSDVRAAAIRVLGEWKTADAAPALLELARNSANPTDKMLCLRSYLGLAANADVPADQRLEMCRQAGALVERNEEVTLLLAALSNINRPESLSLILPHLDRAANKDEAVTAALAISDKMLRSEDAAKIAPQLIEPLQRIAQSGANTELINRTQALLKQAQSKSPAK